MNILKRGKKENMEKEKNTYDLTPEELQEKFMNYFNQKYSKFSYTEDDWNQIQELVNKFNEEILTTNFPLALYNETNYKISQFKKTNEESTAHKIFTNIIGTLGKVGRAIGTFFNSIKFVFSILGLTIASVAITMFVHLLIGNFLYPILPDAISPLMIESILASIIFIGFKVWMFMAKEDQDILFDYKREIIKFVCTIPFYALIFLIFLKLDTFEFLENIKFLFYPHLWLSAFTGEFVFSPMIALTVNCLISIGIYLLIRKKTEK